MNVLLEVGNFNTVIRDCSKELSDYLYEKMAVFKKDAKWSNAYRMGVWDGKRHFCSKKGVMFRTGLLSWACQLLFDWRSDINLAIKDSRVVPNKKFDSKHSIVLRDYQIEVLDQAKKCTRGIISAATGCLTGDSVIGVNRAGKSFSITLDKLVALFNGKKFVTERKDGFGGRMYCWDNAIPTRIRSFSDKEGCVKLHKLKSAYVSGEKTVFELVLFDGKSIKATEEHRFLTANGWKQLKEITVDDYICVEASKKGSNGARSKPRYKVTFGMKNHPYRCKGSGRWVCPKHRLVYEANLNGLTYDEYVIRIRSNDTIGLLFLNPKESHIHHVDGNVANNSIDNLKLYSGAEHFSYHGKTETYRNCQKGIAFIKVKAIVNKGKQKTYDLEMDGEPRNYLANNIVVHNSGKTEIALALIAELGVPTIFIVDNLDILNQTIERAKKHMPDITIRSICKGTSKIIPGSTVDPLLTVTTFQTLYKKRYLTDKCAFDMKISDEAHGCAAETWEVVMSYFDTYYSFGLSGSIEETLEDQERLYTIMGMTGKQIAKIPAHRLVTDGILATPKIRILRYKVNLKVPYSYAEEYRIAVTTNHVLNRCIVPEILNRHKGSRVIILVERIEHGKMLSESLNAPFICGTDADSIRSDALESFKEGKTKVLIASKIFKQGIDIPNVQVLLSLGCDKAHKSIIQKFGRGLRKTADKDEIIYYDVYPDTEHFMTTHAKHRMKIYKLMNFTYNVRDVRYGD